MSSRSEKFVRDSDSDSADEADVYQPPQGYKRVKVSKPVNLDDKEIWLVKYPKELPLGQLKRIPISFTNNATYFTNESKEFEVFEETFNLESNKYTIFKGEDTSFHNSEKPVSRFFNICETVTIPEIKMDKVVVPRQDVEKIGGLRMRHFPTGYGSGDYEEAQKVELPVEKKAKIEKSEKKDKKTKKEKKDKKAKKDKKEKKDKKNID